MRRSGQHSPYTDEATMPPGLRGSPGRESSSPVAAKAITRLAPHFDFAPHRPPPAAPDRARVRHAPRRGQHVACAKIEPCGADVACPGRGTSSNVTMSPLAARIFLNDDGVGALRHHAAGEDAHRFAWPEPARKGMTGGRAADHAQRGPLDRCCAPHSRPSRRRERAAGRTCAMRIGGQHAAVAHSPMRHVSLSTGLNAGDDALQPLLRPKSFEHVFDAHARGAGELLRHVRRQAARAAGEKGLEFRRRHAGLLRPVGGAQAMRDHEGAEGFAARRLRSDGRGRGAATSLIKAAGLRAVAAWRFWRAACFCAPWTRCGAM